MSKSIPVCIGRKLIPVCTDNIQNIHTIISNNDNVHIYSGNIGNANTQNDMHVHCSSADTQSQVTKNSDIYGAFSEKFHITPTITENRSFGSNNIEIPMDCKKDANQPCMPGKTKRAVNRKKKPIIINLQMNINKSVNPSKTNYVKHSSLAQIKQNNLFENCQKSGVKDTEISKQHEPIVDLDENDNEKCNVKIAKKIQNKVKQHVTKCKDDSAKIKITVKTKAKVVKGEQKPKKVKKLKTKETVIKLNNTTNTTVSNITKPNSSDQHKKKADKEIKNTEPVKRKRKRSLSSRSRSYSTYSESSLSSLSTSCSSYDRYTARGRCLNKRPYSRSKQSRSLSRRRIRQSSSSSRRSVHSKRQNRLNSKRWNKQNSSSASSRRTYSYSRSRSRSRSRSGNRRNYNCLRSSSRRFRYSHSCSRSRGNHGRSRSRSRSNRSRSHSRHKSKSNRPRSKSFEKHSNRGSRSLRRHCRSRSKSNRRSFSRDRYPNGFNSRQNSICSSLRTGSQMNRHSRRERSRSSFIYSSPDTDSFSSSSNFDNLPCDRNTHLSDIDRYVDDQYEHNKLQRSGNCPPNSGFFPPDSYSYQPKTYDGHQTLSAYSRSRSVSSFSSFSSSDDSASSNSPKSRLRSTRAQKSSLRSTRVHKSRLRSTRVQKSSLRSTRVQKSSLRSTRVQKSGSGSSRSRSRSQSNPHSNSTCSRSRESRESRLKQNKSDTKRSNDSRSIESSLHRKPSLKPNAQSKSNSQAITKHSKEKEKSDLKDIVIISDSEDNTLENLKGPSSNQNLDTNDKQNKRLSETLYVGDINNILDSEDKSAVTKWQRKVVLKNATIIPTNTISNDTREKMLNIADQNQEVNVTSTESRSNEDKNVNKSNKCSLSGTNRKVSVDLNNKSGMVSLKCKNLKTTCVKTRLDVQNEGIKYSQEQINLLLEIGELFRNILKEIAILLASDVH